MLFTHYNYWITGEIKMNNDDKKEPKDLEANTHATIEWRELLRKHLENNKLVLPTEEAATPWFVNPADMGLLPLESNKNLVYILEDNSDLIDPELMREFVKEAKELIKKNPASTPIVSVDSEPISPNGDNSQWNVSNQPLGADGKPIELQKFFITDADGIVWEKLVAQGADESTPWNVTREDMGLPPLQISLEETTPNILEEVKQAIDSSVPESEIKSFIDQVKKIRDNASNPTSSTNKNKPQ
jgi:hypothetical protein